MRMESTVATIATMNTQTMAGRAVEGLGGLAPSGGSWGGVFWSGAIGGGAGGRGRSVKASAGESSGEGGSSRSLRWLLMG